MPLLTMNVIRWTKSKTHVRSKISCKNVMRALSDTVVTALENCWQLRRDINKYRALGLTIITSLLLSWRDHECGGTGRR